MKTRLLIIIGLVMAIIITVFFIISEQRFFESQTELNPAFLSGYPRVSENDMLCSTSWVIHHKDSIDPQLITEKIRQKISEYGEGYDIAERKITIKSIDENTSRIDVVGVWGDNRESGESYLTLFVKTFGFMEIEKPRVACV